MTTDLDVLDAPPLFLLGMAGSGAAWVYEFLTKHPEVAGVRESWLFAPPEVADRATSAERLAEALRPHHRYLVERSSAHVFHIEAIADAWPEARFLHVLRDGRDVALKVRSAAHAWPPEWVREFGNTFRTAGVAWTRSVEAVMAARRELGDRFLEIRFEELNFDHFEAARRVLDFAGFDYTVDFILRTLEADDRRLDLPEPPDPWKTHYSIWRAKLFDKVAGEALIRTHYEEDRGWWFRPFKRF